MESSCRGPVPGLIFRAFLLPLQAHSSSLGCRSGGKGAVRWHSQVVTFQGTLGNIWPTVWLK